MNMFEKRGRIKWLDSDMEETLELMRRKRHLHGILHFCASEAPRYENIQIEGEEIELTVFNGHFENMLTDHCPVPAIGIIVGHYNVRPNLWYRHSGGFLMENDKLFMGITYVKALHILDGNYDLTKKAVGKFMQMHQCL